MNTPIRNLETIGYVELLYPRDLRIAVDRAVSSWKAFCALPAESKKSLPYSNGADGVGYELKEGSGPKGDRKENFDATTGGRAWLEKHASTVGEPSALRFVNDAVSLVGVMKPLVVDFARAVEREFEIEGFASEVESSEDAFFVRFIHYFGDRALGEETAAAHADQSGFTLHLFESAPGLQYLSLSDHSWAYMPVSTGETVVIPSMQLQLRSGGRLKALSHRVIATPETAQAGRYSAVCFVQLKKTPKYDKDRHGRLQEKPAGFNYDMPVDIFKGLFKS